MIKSPLGFLPAVSSHASLQKTHQTKQDIKVILFWPCKPCRQTRARTALKYIEQWHGSKVHQQFIAQVELERLGGCGLTGCLTHQK